MNTKHQLFLDLDGVLVNLEKGFLTKSNDLDFHAASEKFGRTYIRHMFATVGSDFWRDLEWINGGQTLWNTAKVLFKHVYILSSTGNTDVSKGISIYEGKMNWIKKNIPERDIKNVYIVNGRHRKQEYSHGSSILVDDLPESIGQWDSNGGYGIVHDHRNYIKTIEELKELSKV